MQLTIRIRSDRKSSKPFGSSQPPFSCKFASDGADLQINFGCLLRNTSACTSINQQSGLGNGQAVDSPKTISQLFWILNKTANNLMNYCNDRRALLRSPLSDSFRRFVLLGNLCWRSMMQRSKCHNTLVRTTAGLSGSERRQRRSASMLQAMCRAKQPTRSDENLCDPILSSPSNSFRITNRYSCLIIGTPDRCARFAPAAINKCPEHRLYGLSIGGASPGGLATAGSAWLDEQRQTSGTY